MQEGTGQGKSFLIEALLATGSGGGGGVGIERWRQGWECLNPPCLVAMSSLRDALCSISSFIFTTLKILALKIGVNFKHIVYLIK